MIIDDWMIQTCVFLMGFIENNDTLLSIVACIELNTISGAVSKLVLP